MLTYICKYTPVELLLAFGISPDMPNHDVADFAGTDSLIHSSVCSHAKRLLDSLTTECDGTEEKRELLLTNCCDSIRRVYDTASPERFSFRMMLDLPHKVDDFGIEHYAGELMRFSQAYERHCGHSFDRRILIREWARNARAWNQLMHEIHEPCIAILGARPSDELLQKIRETLPCTVIDLTCGGLRSLPAPPEEILMESKGTVIPTECPSAHRCDVLQSEQESCPGTDRPSPGSEAAGRKMECDRRLFRAYSRALLLQTPCMRMTDTSSRSELLRNPNIIGIVYHSVRFCDYYSFEYADIRRKTDLPVLKIESDYTSQSEGQLATRLEAFRESLSSSLIRSEETKAPSSSSTGMNQTPASNSNKEDPKVKSVYVGIDSGSTTTNGAAIDEDGHLLASSIVRTGARAGDAAQRVLEELKKESEISGFRIRKIAATGYGRDHITFADDVRTEISCHARGAFHVHPEVRTIIDIGGQDSKVICIDEKGNVTNFVMNDKCAAGTGRFLEMMAHTLELSLDQMSEMGLTWKKDLTITSTCTVFAESEVVSLVAENSSTNDIIHALDKSIARKTVSMVKRVHGNGPYMMTGGVARNKGVAREIERALEAPLFISDNPDPDLIGAIGAALYARELA